MKAGVYIRVSDPRQEKHGESLGMQEARARELCKANDWEMTELYVDVETGKSDKRPALMRFERDLRAGRFQAVICYRVDRLGRTRRKLHEILEYVAQQGIRLVSMTQPIDTSTAIGRMMLGLMIEMAVFEIEQLGERVSDTLLHLAKQGRIVGGSAPYGYRHIKKRIEVAPDGSEVTIPPRLVVVPEEAEGVRLAFATYLERSSIAAAMKALNAADYRTRNGKPWDVTAVRMMLLNPLYGGERAVQRYPVVGGKQKRRSRVVADIGEWLIVPSTHEAIVSADDTRCVRERYASSRDLPASTRTGRNPWGGLVVCGLCGYRPYSYDPGGGRGLYFRCRHAMGQACDLRMVAVEWLDREVLPAIASAVDASSLIRQAGERKAPSRARRAAPAEAGQERQVAAKRRELDRLELRFDNEIISGSVYLEDRKRILSEIEDLQAEKPAPTPVAVLALPGTFRATWGALEGAEGIEDRRALLRLVIKEIRVDNERAVVELMRFSGVDLPAVLEVPRWQPYQRPPIRWCRDGDACRECGTASEIHHARGLCRACYERDKYRRRKGLANSSEL